MKDLIFESAIELPESVGVFNLIDAQKRSLYVGAAENIKNEVERICAINRFLKKQTDKIAAFEVSEDSLIEFFNRTIRHEKPLYNFSLAEQNVYPHFKITNEKFPRVLVTRRIADDKAEYFGAFLPETGVRFMLGFINRMFKTRGCTISIDGKFLVPCPEFYRKRCLAPCVENLCNREQYLETINFARLFLENNQTEFERIARGKIEYFSENLNFERAAKLRDFLQTVISFLNDKDRHYALDNATDTFEIKQHDAKIYINLVTQRKRKNLGRRTLVFENRTDFSPQEILAQTVWQFYAFHTPKEIFVPFDFSSRKFLEKILRARKIRGQTKISVLTQSNRKVTVERALKRTAFEYEQKILKPRKTLGEIQTEFQTEFALAKKPSRIEAFDVAHISGTDLVGAKAVWENGKFVPEKYEFWFFDAKSELETLTRTVEKRFQSKRDAPDLILIDGGKAQLQAVLKVFSKKIPIVSAVKPPQKHNEISHFLFPDGSRKNFDKNSDVAQILLKLRDEAHALANYIHRTKRETAHFYETAQTLGGLSDEERKYFLQKFGSSLKLKNASLIELIGFIGAEKGERIYKQLRETIKDSEPFIVPIRFDDPNGEAADLGRPLDLSRNFYKTL